LNLTGLPVRLNSFEASEILTNKQFQDKEMPGIDRFYLPDSMTLIEDSFAVDSADFIADDNRGAVSSSPFVNIDGTDFFLSVKGIGSTTNPFTHQVFAKTEIADLLTGPALKTKLLNTTGQPQRYITGELWLRGSPYGGQGLQHAMVALNISEMADLTSIKGFRIAPLVKIVCLPQILENNIKDIFWYRRFRGRIVQEIRLVPSNLRVYFHAGSTIGSNIGSVFAMFGIDSNEKALAFLVNFVRSGIAFLTLFSRSMRSESSGNISGLDFYDVWLDKDAVLAPDGTVYFVDLEGLEWITVPKGAVSEKIDDQIYRSLYEFMFAYEQIERERIAKFGQIVDRRAQFETLLKSALEDDTIVGLEHDGERLDLVVGNSLGESALEHRFPIIDF
jgi:hypothetical protein